MKEKKETLTDYLFEHPEKLEEWQRIWREMTKGMTYKERKDFAKWHDESMPDEVEV